MKKSTFISASLISSLMLISINPAIASINKPAQMIKNLSHNQLIIEKTLPVNSNLSAYIVQPKSMPGAKQIIYSDNGGNYLILGQLIDKDGKSLNQQIASKYILPKITKETMKLAEKSNYFTQGSKKAPHQAYVFFDPNCIMCHELYLALQPYINNNQLQVHWIIVGIMKPSSINKAAQILSAKTTKNKIALMKQNEDNCNLSREEGGLKGISTQHSTKSNDSKLYSLVNANNNILIKSGIPVTPIILYKNTKGKQVLQKGLVEGAKLQSLINDMGTLSK